MPRYKAVLLVAGAAALFSTAGLMIKLLSLSPLALVGGRGILAAGVIAAWLRRPQFTWSVAQVGGAVALALTQILFVVATRQTTAANAIFLQFTAPIFVAILGVWFLGERLRQFDWLAIAATMAGLLLFLGDDLTTQGGRGNVYAFLSSITFAWFILFLRKQKDGSATETTLLGNLLVALVGLPFLLTESVAVTDWMGMLFLGVIQLGIPFIMISVAIKYLTAVEEVLIQTLEPVLNPIWVFLVIGEAPSLLGLSGGVIVLAAVTARALVASRR